MQIIIICFMVLPQRKNCELQKKNRRFIFDIRVSNLLLCWHYKAYFCFVQNPLIKKQLFVYNIIRK